MTGDGPAIFETERISTEDERARALSAAADMSLLLYHRDGSEVVPLPDGARIIVGRGPGADVVVSDPSLSRRHAGFERTGSVVICFDVGSTNGTLIAGRAIDRAEVRPGDEVSIGGVVATVHALRPRELSALGLESHDRMRALIDDELTRARYFHRSLCVAAIRSRTKNTHVGRWLPAVRAALRPIDRAALYSADTLELVLPEVNEAEADRVLAAIAAATPSPLQAGRAMYPADGASADELLARALDMRGERRESSQIAVGLRAVFETVELVARSTIPVVIRGETGSGKELVARAIHERGPRREKPLAPINCASIPAQLLESTLFGHQRGAFTGAERETKGVFEWADGGTVFLDEIGELPPAAQAALLRVLESKRFTRVGSMEEITVDVRVIAATHRDLERMAEEGSFRRDLWYRLNGMIIEVPPLRERREEIPQLVERFIAGANEANGRTIGGIDADALERIVEFAWPGNVRELKNAIERAVVIARGESIALADLPANVRGRATAAEEPGEDGDELAGSLKDQMRKHEQRVILAALKTASWNQTKAARLLDVPIRTLAHKMKALRITRLGFTGDDD